MKAFIYPPTFGQALSHATCGEINVGLLTPTKRISDKNKCGQFNQSDTMWQEIYLLSGVHNDTHHNIPVTILIAQALWT